MPKKDSQRPKTDGKTRVTVIDVARHAGVSQATVSQVLNGSRPVSEATSARVLRSIELLGYRPNQLARALRYQRSQTVAIVVPNMLHEIYPSVAHGVSEVLRPLGYQVALYDTDNAARIETQVVRAIAERMTDGVILFGHPLTRTDARILLDLDIALVNGGLDDDVARPWDTVRIRQADAMRDMVVLLASRYDGPIAYVGGPADHSTAPVREAGFRSGMALVGRDIDESLMITIAEYSWASGRDEFARLLAHGKRPRLAICANDLVAIGAIAAARSVGLRVPEDIAVSGFDNTVAAAMSVPPLTTIETYPYEQGRACARLLLDRIDGGYTGPPRFMSLAAEIVERESA